MGPSNKGNGRTVKEWKEAQRNRQSGSSSIRASRASTSSDSTTFKRQRPLLFSIFNDSKEGLPDHAVSKQNPFVYTARPERSNQPSQSTRTVRSSSTHSDSSAKGLFASQERTTTTHIPRNDFSLAGLQNSSGPEQSKLCHAISYSESNLSSWAAPVAAKSTYTSVTASPTRGHISQPLSPIPFATQSTEVHIPSKRESTKRSDQLATSVCIPSNNTLPPKTRDSPSQPNRSFRRSCGYSQTLRNHQVTINQPHNFPTLLSPKAPAPWQPPKEWDYIQITDTMPIPLTHPTPPPPKNLERIRRALRREKKALPTYSPRILSCQLPSSSGLGLPVIFRLSKFRLCCLLSKRCSKDYRANDLSG